MNVADSSAWIEFFVDGPNARVFKKPVGDASALLVPSVTILEVYRYVLRERNREQALQAASTMRQGNVVALDETLAIEAAELGASLGLPLADSIIYATTLAHQATLWTQDTDFKDLEHVEYRAKRGAR